MTLEEAIVSVLKDHPEGITAKDIAKILGVTKGDINPILYRSENTKYRKLPQSFIWVLVEQKPRMTNNTRTTGSPAKKSQTKTLSDSRRKSQIPLINQEFVKYMKAKFPDAIYVLKSKKTYYVYGLHAQIVKKVCGLSIYETPTGLEYTYSTNRQKLIGNLSRYQVDWLLLDQEELIDYKFYGQNNRYVPFRDAKDANVAQLKSRVSQDQFRDDDYAGRLTRKDEELAQYIDRIEGTAKLNSWDKYDDDDYY